MAYVKSLFDSVGKLHLALSRHSLAYYLENGKNFIDHKYATEYAVGQLRSIKLSSDKTAWTNRSHIFSGLKSPFADDLLAMTKQAGIGASIGFEMIEGSPPTDRDPVSYRKAGFIIRKWRMVELSFTAMPCNVSCRTMHETGMDQEDEKMAIIDTMITKSAIRLESAVALGFPYRKSVSVATPKRRVGTVIRMSGLDTAVRFV